MAPALPKVGVGRCHVIRSLVVAVLVVMRHEGFDLASEVAWQNVVSEQDVVLHGLKPARDLALRLGMQRGAVYVTHPVDFDPLGPIVGNVAGAVVAEQLRLVLHCGLIAAGSLSVANMNSAQAIAVPRQAPHYEQDVDESSRRIAALVVE